MTKKLILSFFLNIVILYLITPFIGFYIYNIGIANTNFIKWFNDLGIQFILQTPIPNGSGSGFEYIIRPMAFIICFTWITLESIIILFSKKTLLDNLLNLKLIKINFLRLRLISKIIIKHLLLLTASIGIITNKGFYYADLFAFYIFGIMIIFDITIIIVTRGQYSGLNYIFRLKYIKKDPKIIGSS
jgi:hypothetical protein